MDTLTTPVQTQSWSHGEAEALESLCAHFGIATEYHDIWKVRHPVAQDSLVALLAEFGVELNAAHTPRAALEAAIFSDWAVALPPVLALHGAVSGWSLAARIPREMMQLQWTLTCEDGTQHHGEFDARAFPESSCTPPADSTLCERLISFALRDGETLPPGYHTLRIEELDSEILIVAAPERCYRPPSTRDGNKVWGPVAQLYALRSQRNWGMGDFTDLSSLVSVMAERGADFIGLNPLHALFPHNPAHASPYSPSSRRQLNVLYIDVEAVEDYGACAPARRLVRQPDFQARVAALREAPLVDYVGVASAKFEVLELLYVHFVEMHFSEGDGAAQDAYGAEFLSFAAAGGAALRQHALFEAIQAHLFADDAAVWGWQVWPEAYRDPSAPAVAAFAVAHADRVRYHQYLQWLAQRQLDRASKLCTALDMGIGLYIDLAVSVDRAGSDAWGAQGSFAIGASVGAPPDEFNPNGQGWGLPPLRPDRLRTDRYRFFIDTLRANMRGAGAIRIDHVMGLMRLFWIPPGKNAREGAYVHYALDEMLSIVSLESERNQCMVIGEDLGTVADEMREALERYDILSYRLLYFERLDAGGFKPAMHYPANALVSVSTHDLATLAGWWAGRDLQTRLALGLFPRAEIFEKQLLDRAQERVRLLFAVQEAGWLTAAQMAEASGSQTLLPEVVNAIHAFLAAAPSAVMAVQLEDVFGVVEQANMPATTHEQPNWRRKLPVDLHEFASSATLQSLAQTMSSARPRRFRQSAASEGQGMHARVPGATYRIQFHKDFGFDDAIRILPYLAQLGITHIYCSPIQRAREGSMHGYDVVAHDQVNPELGGREGFDRFTAALKQHGMGQLLDMVPNHMGVLGADNAWWMDVLENGPASRYAQHFDIDWQPLNAELTGKVLLPVLGDHYGDALARGDIELQFEDERGSLVLRYFEHRLPLAPETYEVVLRRAEPRIEDEDIAGNLASVASAFAHLPGRAVTDPSLQTERARDKELLKERLSRLVVRQPTVAGSIAAAVADLNLASARDDLHALIEAQAYRLAYWRVASDEINYRRFFDINELAALRMERDEVFEATQGFALDLVASGAADGLRIDHPDGLYDPAAYFAQLQDGYARRAGLVLPDFDAQGRPVRPLYVVAEKIAAPHEEVPETWHVHGTTGYRFANVANSVLIDGTAARKIQSIWRNFTGVTESFHALARAGKSDVMRTALSSELNVLSTELLRIARSDRRTRDYTLNALRRALSEVAASMPVYRTYVIDSASPQDVQFIDQATRDAEQHSRDADLSVFGFLRQTLLGEAVVGGPSELAVRVRRFAIRFQQFSAPVAAKGVEDTAFYQYFPLSSINEVGGEPAIFGMTVQEFHEASADRSKRWPHTMLATSTHDNKRSEDVRNRIDVLSEMPATWRLALRRWRAMSRPHRARLEAEGKPHGAPSHADEYLLYQTLLGTLPSEGLASETLATYRERIVTYMTKAVRESKVHTRWTNPNEDYEGALTGFIGKLLERVAGNAFLVDLQALADRLAWFGALNSLSLTLLKYTSPGVPDLYQGTELMDLSLVDPDNRRPVDYGVRERYLQELSGIVNAPNLGAKLVALVAQPFDGKGKLWIVWRLLTLRNAHPALLRDGDYQGLAVHGDRATHVIAFLRRHGDVCMLVITGRLFATLDGSGEGGELSRVPPVGGVWANTTVALPRDLEGRRFVDALTGAETVVRRGVVGVADAMAHFPGAVLVSEFKA